MKRNQENKFDKLRIPVHGKPKKPHNNNNSNNNKVYWDQMKAPDPFLCPYDDCDGHMVLQDSTRVYGVSYGQIYLCSNFPTCDARIGVHDGTNNPKGTPARQQLRRLRMRVHQYLDPIWKQGRLTRGQAYLWLSKKMHIPFNECHIGLFTVKQCYRALEILEPLYTK